MVGIRYDSGLGDPGDLAPQIQKHRSFGMIEGDQKTVSGSMPNSIGQQIPGKSMPCALKVVAKREIASISKNVCGGARCKPTFVESLCFAAGAGQHFCDVVAVV